MDVGRSLGSRALFDMKSVVLGVMVMCCGGDGRGCDDAPDAPSEITVLGGDG
jgi:hypothetical protein